MTAAKQLQLVSVEDYLAGELTSDVKHEYRGGYVYAMAGAQVLHNRVAGNWYFSIARQLEGGNCEPFNSDMKVRIQFPTHTRFYYPDGMVVCDSNPDDYSFQDRPIIIAEVISESTRRIDEQEKCEAYLTIPSLQYYLLIETEQPKVVMYRRGPQGFDIEVYEGLGSVLPLRANNANISLKELYARVVFQGTI